MYPLTSGPILIRGEDDLVNGVGCRSDWRKEGSVRNVKLRPCSSRMSVSRQMEGSAYAVSSWSGATKALALRRANGAWGKDPSAYADFSRLCGEGWTGNPAKRFDDFSVGV